MSDTREPSSPRDLLLSGLRDEVPPIITDPRDGLPRPADESYTQAPVQPANDQNFICQEGGAWVRWDQGTGATSDPAVQPLDEDLELVGFTSLGRKVVNAPYDDRIFAHVRTKELFRRSRPTCQWYAELESVITEIQVDNAKAPRTILRKCTKMDLVLTDMVLKACTQREPRDVVSEARLVEKAREKAKLAAMAPTPLFRQAAPSPTEAIQPIDATSDTFAASFVGPAGEQVVGMLLGYHPVDPPRAVLRGSPLIVLFPDAVWQPPDSAYYLCVYEKPSGEEKIWSDSLSGEQIARMKMEADDDPEGWTGNQRWLYGATVEAIAKALINERNVAVVPYHASTKGILIASIQEKINELFAAEPHVPEKKKRTP